MKKIKQQNECDVYAEPCATEQINSDRLNAQFKAGTE